jgi:hypothetical protein
MTLVNVIAYTIVFGLPIWLVTEEIAHRLVAFRKSGAAAQATAPAGRERHAPEGVRAHASFV